MNLTVSDLVHCVRLIRAAKSAIGADGAVDWGQVCLTEPESLLAVADLIVPGGRSMPAGAFFQAAQTGLIEFAAGIGSYLEADVTPHFEPLNRLLRQAVEAIE